VAQGLVVATARERVVAAVDLATGRERWRFATGPDLPFRWEWDFWLSSPTIVGGRVYVGSGDGNLYALELATGRKLWQFATGGRIRSSPAVDGSVAYVGSMDGKLYALDAATGGLLWSFATAGVSLDSEKEGFDRLSVVSSPAVSEGLVAFGSRDARLYAVDRKTGAERWRFGHRIESMEGAPEVSWVLGSPALFEGLVLTGSSDGRFFNAVREETGEEVWRFKTPKNVLSSGAVAGGQVFFGCEDGHLFALDVRTGRERWRFRTGGAIVSSPLAAGGSVYVGSDDGNLYAIDTGPERPGARTRRAIYWKDSGARKWFKGNDAIKDYFVSEGYELLDDTGLPRFLAEPADAARSVIVVAGDTLPPDAFAGAPEASLLRRYLAAGGRMVWLGLPPDCFERDPATQQAIRYDPGRTTRLLGVRQEPGKFDWMGATATADGRRWGVPDWYIGAFGVPPADVTTILGLDEFGLATAWIKSYGGPPGSGFVRLWGREDPIPDPSWVQAVAEHVE
jgi:outer membrane protein assembly factor BamB